MGTFLENVGLHPCCDPGLPRRMSSRGDTHPWPLGPASRLISISPFIHCLILLLVSNHGMPQKLNGSQSWKDKPAAVAFGPNSNSSGPTSSSLGSSLHNSTNNFLNSHPLPPYPPYPDSMSHSQQQLAQQQHAAYSAQQQYASFEELQKLAENPFENNTSINVTVPLGDSAFLRCKVRNLGERSISWYRRRDWHILTTGKTTFSNDERFHVLHSDGSDEWTLQIKFVQKRDNGTYECQVSTGTGIVSYLVHLHVAIPEAFILGNGEYHVEQGSNINLVCIIEKSPKAPEYIFWYHNDRMINYGSSREVTVHTEPGSKTQSRLTIRDARISDSGNYTCETANADPASIYVYVSQASGLFSGDKIAAIQRRNEASAAASSPSSSSSLQTCFKVVNTLILFLVHDLISNLVGSVSRSSLSLSLVER